MGKQNQFIQRATKNADRNHDAKKLDPIQNFLIKLGISTVRERTIYNEKFTQKYKERTPDLTFTSSPRIILLEHDTVKIHGELGYENAKTLKRNQDFTRAGISFAVLNADLAKDLGLNENSLAAYLYYHELMKINSHE